MVPLHFLNFLIDHPIFQLSFSLPDSSISEGETYGKQKAVLRENKLPDWKIVYHLQCVKNQGNDSMIIDKFGDDPGTGVDSCITDT